MAPSTNREGEIALLKSSNWPVVGEWAAAAIEVKTGASLQNCVEASSTASHCVVNAIRQQLLQSHKFI
jgi:hypothetical protein